MGGHEHGFVLRGGTRVHVVGGEREGQVDTFGGIARVFAFGDENGGRRACRRGERGSCGVCRPYTVPALAEFPSLLPAFSFSFPADISCPLLSLITPYKPVLLAPNLPSDAGGVSLTTLPEL